VNAIAPSTRVDVNEAGGVQFFAPDVPDISVERVLRIQGYSNLDDLRPRVRSRIIAAATDAIERTREAAAPACAWTRTTLSNLSPTGLTLADTISLQCRAFTRFLDGADDAVVFAVTLGEPFDRLVTETLGDDELLAGVLMESAGWLAVEAITKQWTVLLRDSARDNQLKLTRRMSPGYQYLVGKTPCEWELDQQHDLFRVFGETPIPVSLLESSAMLPKMSRSGLIGLRPA